MTELLMFLSGVAFSSAVLVPLLFRERSARLGIERELRYVEGENLSLAARLESASGPAKKSRTMWD